jgi:hypothetical protein
MDCFVVRGKMRAKGGIAVMLSFVYGFSSNHKESLLAHFEEWYHPPVSPGEPEKKKYSFNFEVQILCPCAALADLAAGPD